MNRCQNISFFFNIHSRVAITWFLVLEKNKSVILNSLLASAYKGNLIIRVTTIRLYLSGKVNNVCMKK